MPDRSSRRIAAAALAATLAAGAGPAAAQTAWEQVVSAAEAEGKVVVIGPPVNPNRETLTLFAKAYPKIKLELTGMAPGQYEPRVAAERKASMFLQDVLISGVSSTIYTRDIAAGMFDTISDKVVSDIAQDRLWLGGYKSGYLDNERSRVYAFSAGMLNVIHIDRSQIPRSELAEPAELINPKWKGKIAIGDPRERGPGSFAVSGLVRAIGRDKTRILLTQQDLVMTNTLRQITEWAVRGQYPITIGLTSSGIRDYLAQGLGKSLEPLKMPPHAQLIGSGWGNVLLFDKAPHPNAARVFVNWLLSREAQNDWAKRSTNNSRRTDVPPGDAPSALDAQAWLGGLNLFAEKEAQARLDDLNFIIEVVKR